MKHKASALLLAATAFSSSHAMAGEILQDSSNDRIQVLFYGPIGQSFVAQDSAVSFAFSFGVLNNFDANTSINLDLREGDGDSGSVIGSFSFSLSDDFSGYFDVDLSSIALAVGQTYTAELTSQSGYFGVDVNLEGNPYANGRGYFSASFFGPIPTPNDDFRFRVTPKVVAAPSPDAWSLFGLGLFGIAAHRRLRSRSTSPGNAIASSLSRSRSALTVNR